MQRYDPLVIALLALQLVLIELERRYPDADFVTFELESDGSWRIVALHIAPDAFTETPDVEEETLMAGDDLLTLPIEPTAPISRQN